MSSHSQQAWTGTLSLRKAAWLMLILYTRLAVTTISPAYQTHIQSPRIPQGDSRSPGHAEQEFSLRHIYHRGAYEDPDLHLRIDVTPGTRLRVLSNDTGISETVDIHRGPLIASSSSLIIHRLVDRRPSVIESHRAYTRSSGGTFHEDAWVMDEISGPDVSDKGTIITLAKMTANDYIPEPGTGDWNQISGRFNWSASFGWLGDGLRGHIYADQTNSTVIISLKGTSPALFDGAETTTNDKINDNLYFSCCCGQGGSYLWRQVCDCATSVYTANETCITEELHEKDRYHESAIDLYTNVTKIYPDADVWLTGHSLGGAMSALLGLTFGLPTVAFQAIPDALPAARLGLPAPPGYNGLLPQSRKYTGIYHIGHTADPIYMGACNGVSSTCTWAGYAFESACHVGEMCVYDTVGDKGWRMSIGSHRINTVISDVLEAYDEIPSCAPEEECYDCQLWKFFKSNGSETTTVISSTASWSSISWVTVTMTPGRSSTCETPGWWGCLDKTSTTTASTTSRSVTTTSTTSTCETPGWFGCRDATTTTTTEISITWSMQTPIPNPPTSTCLDPGWIGCRDQMESTSVSGTSVGHLITPAPIF